MGEPQTTEQLYFISNLAHWVEGGLLAIVTVIAFAQAVGYAKSKGAQYLWPALILIGGVFLPAYMLLWRGVGNVGLSWNLIIKDPQQREHLLMASFLVVGGAVEILYRARILRREFWKFTVPVALVMIGAALFIHTQVGTPEAVAEAVSKHHYQGGSIILAGLFRAADLHWHYQRKWLAFPWIAMLLVAAVLLITYCEPEGTFLSDSLRGPRSEDLEMKSVFIPEYSFPSPRA